MPIAINGSGTVTGISVGGLPDGIVDTDTLATSVIRGKVLQSLGSSGNSTIVTSGATISDLTTVTITPASSSNKILLLGNCTLYTNPNNNAYAGTYLYINNAGVILEVNINGAGDNVIIINQSP